MNPIDPNEITIWGTDGVLDYLSDKPYKEQVLKEIRATSVTKMKLTHLSKTEEISNEPMYVLIFKGQEGDLGAAVANKNNFKDYVGALARAGTISEYQYNTIIKEANTL